MSDLVAFLQARLDEREKKMRPAPDLPSEGSWHTARCGFDLLEFQAPCDCEVPACIAADAAAVRALIAVAASWQHRADSDAWVFCPLSPETRRRFPDDWDDGGARCMCGRDRQVLAVLGPFAAVHATHPDYRPEWKPTGAAGVWW